MRHVHEGVGRRVGIERQLVWSFDRQGRTNSYLSQVGDCRWPGATVVGEPHRHRVNYPVQPPDARSGAGRRAHQHRCLPHRRLGDSRSGHGSVLFTFALSGPLPPKEMGIVLGVVLLLDAFLVRLVLPPVLLRRGGLVDAPSWLTRVLPNIRFSRR